MFVYYCPPMRQSLQFPYLAVIAVCIVQIIVLRAVLTWNSGEGSCAYPEFPSSYVSPPISTKGATFAPSLLYSSSAGSYKASLFTVVFNSTPAYVTSVHLLCIFHNPSRSPNRLHGLTFVRSIQHQTANLRMNVRFCLHWVLPCICFCQRQRLLVGSSTYEIRGWFPEKWGKIPTVATSNHLSFLLSILRISSFCPQAQESTSNHF